MDSLSIFKSITTTYCSTFRSIAARPVQVRIFRLLLFQHVVGDLKQGLVVDHEDLLRILQQLMDGQGGIIRLHHHIRDLRRRIHREGRRDSVRIIIPDLEQQQSAHSRSSAASDGLRQLESLRTVTSLGFTANDVHRLVDQLCALSVVVLDPGQDDRVQSVSGMGVGWNCNGAHCAQSSPQTNCCPLPMHQSTYYPI